MSTDLKQDVENLERLLKLQKEMYESAFQYIDKAIYTYTQHSSINHQENNEYQKGQIDGLIQASKIVDNTLRVIKETLETT